MEAVNDLSNKVTRGDLICATNSGRGGKAKHDLAFLWFMGSVVCCRISASANLYQVTEEH